jgi:PBP1b-binding outer membrane lipoprotein LpoB
MKIKNIASVLLITMVLASCVPESMPTSVEVEIEISTVTQTPPPMPTETATKTPTRTPIPTKNPLPELTIADVKLIWNPDEQGRFVFARVRLEYQLRDRLSRPIAVL